eukprot:162623_1
MTEFACRAIYDYCASTTDELDLKEGQEYTITDASSYGWWYAVNADCDEGWVPSGYLERIDSGGGGGGGAQPQKDLNSGQVDSVDPVYWQCKVGNNIDCRDRWGAWFGSTITQHKKATEQEFEAIYVHYIGWPKQYDEWILIDTDGDIFCNCGDKCRNEHNNQHRIAKEKTQTVYAKMIETFGDAVFCAADS